MRDNFLRRSATNNPHAFAAIGIIAERLCGLLGLADKAVDTLFLATQSLQMSQQWKCTWHMPKAMVLVDAGALAGRE